MEKQDAKFLVELAEVLIGHADRIDPPLKLSGVNKVIPFDPQTAEPDGSLEMPMIDLTCGQIGCESTDLDGIGYCIKHHPTNYWKLRPFDTADFESYPGVDDLDPRIANVIVDGFIGELILEPQHVEIHFTWPSANVRNWLTKTFARDFGKDGVIDDFLADCDLGYLFAEWALQIMQRDQKEFGLDDLRDILGMEEV